MCMAFWHACPMNEFMGGGGGCANEVKMDQTSEMYFLLSNPFIQESSNT